MILAQAQAAGAWLITGLDNTIDPTANSTVNTVQVASLLVGVFIPILVGLVTKHSTSAAVKSLLLLALSAVSGFLTEFINSANFVWQQALLSTVVTFVIGVATHYGLWQPTGVTAKAQNSLVHDHGPHGQHGATDLRVVGAVLIVAGIVVWAVFSAWLGAVLVVVGLAVLIYAFVAASRAGNTRV